MASGRTWSPRPAGRKGVSAQGTTGPQVRRAYVAPPARRVPGATQGETGYGQRGVLVFPIVNEGRSSTDVIARVGDSAWLGEPRLASVGQPRRRRPERRHQAYAPRTATSGSRPGNAEFSSSSFL